MIITHCQRSAPHATEQECYHHKNKNVACEELWVQEEQASLGRTKIIATTRLGV